MDVRSIQRRLVRADPPGKDLSLGAHKGGKYVGSAVVALPHGIRERLWERVKTKAGPAPKGVNKPEAQWVKPGFVGRVRFLKCEEMLRHATLKDVREDSE